jgi:4-hydroxybenzoate polyprenyltransferase
MAAIRMKRPHTNNLWSYLELTHPYAAGSIFMETIVFTLLADGGALDDAWRLVLVVGVVILAQACVGITNELCDMPRDAQTKPYRQLISGRVAPTTARKLAWVTGSGALVVGGVMFGWVGIVFPFLAAGAGLLYNVWLKGTRWSWFPYAVSFSLLPLWPFAALDHWRPALAWIWLLIVPASIALNIAQSLGDIEEDRAFGVGGLAEWLGTDRARLVLWGTSLLTIILALATAWPSLTFLLMATALIAGGLIGIAAWYAHRHPGPAAWSLTWRCVAAAMAIVGIGWFHAIL